MPFKTINVEQLISETTNRDIELKQLWDETRTEYRILGELVKLRKEKGITQAELADKTRSKQQAISKIENKENSPTLKTLCAILDVLEYDIQLVPRA